MTMTTIKVSVQTRDRLKAQAAASKRSLGSYLEELAEVAERRARFERLRAAMAATPQELRDSYDDERRVWDRLEWEGME
ncbi:antitoxin [Pseudactinotalea sp. HY158]|uniref:antitoxin n=1 Tax=Pseudactinotalea sp. HY158 TaxID=2654547 RepID=UPI00129C32DB|nr:antitoxin [Pseudactinotalea sp. HY158]QGH70564.1 antitoxin [Pseudactinotalea sp. HY158]